jgi:hypothetical protein
MHFCPFRPDIPSSCFMAFHHQGLEIRPELEDAPTTPSFGASAPLSTTAFDVSARVSEGVFLRRFRPDINRDGTRWRDVGKAVQLAAGVTEQVV